MATFDYNPITGNLDLVGSGASYINGVVADPTALPVTLGTPALDSVFLAKAGSGVWLINRRPAGLYCRVANNGNAADWTYLGAFPEVNADGNWELYNSADPTKELKFDLSGIATGTTRTITVPNKNVTLDDASDARTPTAHNHAASAITSGVFDNARINFAAPSAIGSTTPSTGAFTTLSANNGTLTASAPVLDLSQTWNNAAVTFTGIQFNITNTASVNAASGSKYFEIAVGGVPQIRFQRNFSTPYLYFGNTDTGVGAGSTTLNIICNGGVAAQIGSGSSGISVRSDAPYQWSSTTGFAAADLQLFRDAADTLAQRRTTNAQTFRIYNTFTDASNYERAKIAWSSNVLQIGTEKLGTGSARALEFQTDGTTRASVTTGGNFWVNNQLILGTTVLARITSPADGVVTLFDSGQATFNRLQFGGTTSSFPALKRSSTALQVRLADDSAFAPLEALSFTTANSRIVCDDTNTVIHVGNTPRISLFGSNATYLGLGNAHDIRWSNTGRSDQAASFNISLARDADGILAQRAGTTAQTWRIYNTVSGTGNVNFERANFRWATNEFIIDAEAGGTGTSLRGIKIGSATSSLLGFYGVTPVDQPATVADPAGGGTVDTEARTAINAIIDRLQELGLIA